MKNKKNAFPSSYGNKQWFITGLSWGAFMFVAMGLIYRYSTHQPFSFTIIAKEFIYWMLAGLIYGISMKLFFKYIKKKD